MILTIPDFLTPAEVKTLREIAARSTFVDGRISNPHNQTKNNQQLDLASPAYQQAAQIVGKAYQRNDDFQRFCFPRRFAPPMLCKYSPGMAYGAHCDSAIVGAPSNFFRSDVSSTVYLSEVADCEGGELRIHLGDRHLDVKLDPGSAVVYPSTTIHEVMPVTRGERLVAITFIESSIRGQAERELLYTLGEIAALEGNKMEWKNRIELEKVRQNLHRMWLG